MAGPWFPKREKIIYFPLFLKGGGGGGAGAIQDKLRNFTVSRLVLLQ